VQVVRLLEHLAEPPRTQVLVVGAPSFHGVGQQRMPETEGRRAERRRYRHVRVRIVIVRVPLRRQLEPVLFHRVPAQELRQEFVVSDMLHHRADNSSRFLRKYERTN